MYSGIVNLAVMIEEQRRFNEKFWHDKPDRVYWTKENLLAAMVEVGEVLDELAWKTHRLDDKEILPSNLREELVDIFKYWLNVWTLWGFTADDLTEEFGRKSDVVTFRYLSEHGLRDTLKPIVLLDIDGVLTDYPGSLYNFVREKTGREWHKLNARERVRAKHYYRESGAKQDIEMTPGAADAVKDLQFARGYFVCAVSSRPYDRYKRTYADTLRWMIARRVLPDAMVFTDDKQRFALEILDRGQQIAFAVEDDVKYANALVEIGVIVYLIDKGDYNLAAASGVRRVNSLEEVAKCVST